MNIIYFLTLTCFQVRWVQAIVGGVTAAPPPPDDPVVFVRLYSRDARIEGIRNNRTGIYTFLGIRYAEPPINANRFLRPEYKRLRGDVDATKFGPPCPQPHPNYPTRVIGNEDCLLVNVYTIKMPDESTGLPVIIWIHGGGFRFGSASQYLPIPLVLKNIIVVSIQYRLGVLGILGDGDREFPGNVALFDMAAAVRWVNEYISYFGGNPDNVKIMGHGSGAASAVYLSQSQIHSRDSITGVIAMSGSPLTQYSLDDEPKQGVNDIALINNCQTTNETEIIQCMRNKNLTELVENDGKIQTERLTGQRIARMMTGYVGTAPTIEQPNDGRGLPGFIVSDSRDDIKNGKIKNIPILCGVTKDETANAIVPKEIETIFQSLDNFLASLKPLINLNGILEFGNTSIIKNQLQANLNLPSLNDYLKLPKNLDPTEILSKLIEMTTDIFFNLPLFLTVKQWSKVAPSFLYRFEYTGSDNRSGRELLAGLPIVSKSSNPKLVGHGDELQFLFDIADIFGNSLNKTNTKTIEDLKVRDSFTNLIANFAGITNATANFDNIFNFLPNSISLMPAEQGNSFIRIGSEIFVENDFRFCQLSTFGLPLKSLNIKSCDLLSPINQIISNVPKINKDVLSDLSTFKNLNSTRNKTSISAPVNNMLGERGSVRWKSTG